MGRGAQLGPEMMSGGNGSVWMSGEGDGGLEKWTEGRSGIKEERRKRKVSFWITAGGIDVMRRDVTL